MTPEELRGGDVADAIRRERLIVVLRRLTPRERLVSLVGELAAAGARIFEVTFDAPDAARDLAAVRDRLDGLGCRVGAGTLLTTDRLRAARDAGADFAVSPTLDVDLVFEAIGNNLPCIPGAFTPTEIASAWDAGATFVKVFPASALGPSFVRELRGPMPEVQLIPTGGVDLANARSFLDAGAVAVGIGSAIVRGDPGARLAMLEAVRA